VKRIDIPKLIADLGGAGAICLKLQAIGVEDITIKGVEKWRERRSLPMGRWLQLVEMVNRTERRELKMDDYLIKGERGGKFTRAA